MNRLPFESAERHALRLLLDKMETPRTQKASEAWDNAHKVLEASRLSAHGFEVAFDKYGQWPCRSNAQWAARRMIPAEARTVASGAWRHLSAHATREAALEACERAYRAEMREAAG